MKNLTEYLKLWQKKRSEMRIDDDADKDWGAMHSLLDEQMPIDGPGSGKKRGISLISIMLMTLAAAAMVAVTAKVVQTKYFAADSHHKIHHHHKNKYGNDVSDSDSLVSADSSQRARDTLTLSKAGVVTDDKLKSSLPADGKPEKKADAISTNPESVKTTDVGKTPETANEHQNTETSGKEGNNKIQHPIGNTSTTFHHPGSDRRTAEGINTVHNQVVQSMNNSLSNSVASFINAAQHHQTNAPLLLEPPRQGFDIATIPFSNYPIAGYSAPQVVAGPLSKDVKSKAIKPRGVRTESNSPLEWGLVIGANSSGSFTSKSQNSNFYGRLPVDAFAGVYGTYDFGEIWGIGMQLRVLNPTIVTGNYEKPYYTRFTDTTNILRYKSIKDTRKVYSVQVPFYAVYHINNNVSFKAGPVISFPVKQYNIAADSATRAVFTQSQYDLKTDIGLSGGVSLRYKRLIFEATYLKGLTTHRTTLDSLSYKSTNNTLQFTIGIQLGGKKK